MKTNHFYSCSISSVVQSLFSILLQTTLGKESLERSIRQRLRKIINRFSSKCIYAPCSLFLVTQSSGHENCVGARLSEPDCNSPSDLGSVADLGLLLVWKIKFNWHELGFEPFLMGLIEPGINSILFLLAMTMVPLPNVILFSCLLPLFSRCWVASF